MRIHLDHNAGAAVDPRVLARFVEVESTVPGNPGSLHGRGRRASGVLEEARADLAAALEVSVDEVFFTSGGTEANNLAVLGAGDVTLPVLCSDAEHASVLEPAQQRGLVRLPVDAAGHAVLAPPAERVGLLCLVHAQNEVGTYQPIAAARALADALAVPLHVDAAQTLGRCSLSETLAAADSLTLSPHKAGGLKGTGVLVARTTRQPLPRPRAFGGGQERGLRPGTPSPALAAATALAVRLALAEWPARAAAMAAARDAFLAALGTDNGLTVISPPDALPNTVMLRFDRVRDGRLLLPALDVAGVEASQGSACSSGSPMPPRVLTAMGLTRAECLRCVRFSVPVTCLLAELREAARIVLAVAARLERS
jgi:cysteine desulfurase